MDHQVVLLVLRMIEFSKGEPLKPENHPSRKFSPLQNRKLLENAFQSQQNGPSLPDWKPFEFYGEDRINLEARRTVLLAELLKDDPITIAERRATLGFLLLVDSPWQNVGAHSFPKSDLFLTGGKRSLLTSLGSLNASQSKKQIPFAQKGTPKQSTSLPD